MDALRSSKENNKEENSDDPEEKRQRLRSAVLKEIFDSESKYLQDLYTLIIYYITPIKTNNRFPEISANPKADVKVRLRKKKSFNFSDVVFYCRVDF
jgi:hypothetical protein